MKDKIMKELLELNQWDNDDKLRYAYVSTDMEYLEDKADRIYKVIDSINKVENRYKVTLDYTGSDDCLEVTLHVLIEINEEYKCKKNKDLEEGDI